MYRHRNARRDDLAAIIAIYNSTVASRQVTADLDPVSIDSRTAWFDAHAAQTYPLWVVEIDNAVAGWLSFSAFYGRPAYRHTAEISIYVDAAFRQQRIGHYLLTQALAHSSALQFNSLLGFIFGHNTPSLRLFEQFGFMRWGELPRVAELDGIERDVVIVGRRIET
ncbi:MAG TPA: GNAT family N-acetyltransferase [Spongiibacteraceae bacterium]|jgi:phosphinothricin acetyltransferase